MISTFLDRIDSYEKGNMSEKEEHAFFQELVNTGMAWHLQGHYGRHAAYLIESGAIATSHAGKNEIK